MSRNPYKRSPYADVGCPGNALAEYVHEDWEENNHKGPTSCESTGTAISGNFSEATAATIASMLLVVC